MSSLLLVGVGLISLSVLVLEISLTRIFSVIHYYHFSFLAISIVLFGSGAGGVYVYSTASRSSQSAPRRLVWMTTWFSLATFATLFLYFRLGPQIAIYPSLISSGEWASVGMISGIYLSMAVPFFFAGAALSLALKLNPERVSRLYCADLVGAGLGCLAVIGLMQWLGAPRTAAASAVLSMVAAWLFRLSAPGEGRRTRSLPWVALALLLLAASVPSGPWRITHAKGRSEGRLVFEGWNTYSRVTVSQAVEDPFGWAMSERRPRGKVSQLMMLIDSAAGTPIVHFDGDLSKVEFLKFDVTSMAHYVRPNARVLVIGAGGGRDVLAALVFQQSSVDAVEINSLVARVLGERFRDFAGHLLEHPRVRFYVEDGRNFVRRSPTSYDLIQLSLVDTWAASAAGALALTENTLYTREAMEDYLDHLTEEGILSISRWYYVPRPSEVLRLVTTALEALGRKGVVSPEACLALVRSLPPESSRWAVGNLLVKRSPFTGEELDGLEATANDLQFDLAFPPRSEASPEILELVRQPDAFIRDYPLDLSPPTDDRPFFFNMSRWRNLATPSRGGTLQANLDTNRLLAGLLGVSFLAVLAAILGPLWWTQRKLPGTGSSGRFAAYFLCLGLGFMLLEISFMQRFILLLGHPIYALALILFVLLSFGGLGSLTVERLSARQASLVCLGITVLSLVVWYLYPLLFRALAHSSTAGKAAATALLLAPVGYLMGMPFPIGLRALKNQALIPWMWGVNGATSVLASILGMILALSMGYTAALVTGAASYLTAFLLLLSVQHAGER